jgi:ribonuclease D
LCGIARRAPRAPSQLDRVRGFEPGRHSVHRAVILELVEHGLAAAQCPSRQGVAPPSAATVAHVLRGVVEHAASELGVPASLLAPFADLTRAASGERELALFRGWRADRLGGQLARFLDGALALRVGPDGPILTAADRLPG